MPEGQLENAQTIAVRLLVSSSLQSVTLATTLFAYSVMLHKLRRSTEKPGSGAGFGEASRGHAGYPNICRGCDAPLLLPSARVGPHAV